MSSLTQMRFQVKINGGFIYDKVTQCVPVFRECSKQLYRIRDTANNNVGQTGTRTRILASKSSHFQCYSLEFITFVFRLFATLEFLCF